MKITKKYFAAIFAMMTVFACFCFSACGDGNGNSSEVTKKHDSSAWFTEEELEKVGLGGLGAPEGLAGVMTTDTYWFGGGYSFSQVCPEREKLEQTADVYLGYFKNRYGKNFGVADFYAHGTTDNTFYYNIVPKINLSNYYDDNPSPLYKFYYITDTSVAEDGYLAEDAVWSLDIRYEFDTSSKAYELKIFIEKENKSRNGIYTYKYRQKN